MHFWTKKLQLPLIYTLSGAFVHFILFSLFYLYWEICCIKVSITLYRLNLFNNLFTCEDQVVFTLHLVLLQQNTNVGFWKSIKCFSQFIFYVISLICKSHCAVPTIISRPYFQEQILQSLPRVGSSEVEANILQFRRFLLDNFLFFLPLGTQFILAGHKAGDEKIRERWAGLHTTRWQLAPWTWTEIVWNKVPSSTSTSTSTPTVCNIY